MMQKVLSTAVVFAVSLAAGAGCGGHKHADTTEGGGAMIDTSATSGDPTDHSGNMVPPEKMDEIQHDLQRKEMIISRCLADAVEAGTVPKGTHGKVTVELVVSPDGHATNVRVVKASIESTEVQGCIKRHVEDIAFPQIPKQFETSYTYAMEAN